MLDKIKTYAIGILVTLSALLGAFLLYYKRKLFISDVVGNDQKLQGTLDKQNAEVAVNDEKLAVQDAQRKEIEDEEAKDDVSSESLADLTKFFTDRKQ